MTVPFLNIAYNKTKWTLTFFIIGIYIGSVFSVRVKRFVHDEEKLASFKQAFSGWQSTVAPQGMVAAQSLVAMQGRNTMKHGSTANHGVNARHSGTTRHGGRTKHGGDARQKHYEAW